MGILDKISKKGGKPEEDKPKAQSPKPKASAKRPVKKTDAKSVRKEVKRSEEPKAEGKKEARGSEKKESRPEVAFAYSIISHPVSTEKSDRQQMLGKYTFGVAKGANKVEIARAIKALYGVSPVSVSVMNVKGKKVRYGRLQGRRKDTRKAVVTLKEGDSISLAE